MAWLVRSLALCALLCACTSSAAPRLLPIPHQSAVVDQTLRVAIDVDNPNGVPLAYRFEASDLVALESVATIGGSPTGADFRYTPLSSHVGTHAITIVLSAPGGSEYDRRDLIVDVTAAADAAPVFLEPGAGATFDLSRDPCVYFPIEIRDDDSATVDVGAAGPLPDGAALVSTGAKSARFDWCPTPDEITASARWTIALQASDHDHAPVPHDFIVVLRASTSMNCPGASPVITLVSPIEGALVTSNAGYDVTITATDDHGLRDAPLLYWTTERPADLAMPDVTTFEQISFAAMGASFVAHVPSLGLAAGETTTVYFTASATDDDDASGTACDHRTDLLPVVSFVAAAGTGGGTTGSCGACAASMECASGICVPATGGARCLDPCGAADACALGGCVPVTTSEGASMPACGDVHPACDPAPICIDDSREDDDTIATARTLAFGTRTPAQICSGDDDFDRLMPMAMDQITIDLAFTDASGDLDLQLLDGTGAILGSSAGTTDTETITYCARDASPLYARVFGYDGAANGYTIDVTRAAGACCVDDAFEPDDSQASARALHGSAFSGTICPSDDDWLSITTTGAAEIAIDVHFDVARADIDIELVGPSGTVIASSLGTTGSEHIDTTVATAGTYAIHVFSLDVAMSNDYAGTASITASATCTTTLSCATPQVCDAGHCRSGACTTSAMCPAMHLCPDAGPGTGPSTCGAVCALNADCRSSETCKWFPEGRACGVHGSAANGATCASFTDCGGQRACLDWPGGYCARAGCASDSDCETGTFCTAVSGTNVCALDCTTDATRCHAGLSCRTIVGVSGTTRHVCAP